MSEITSATAYVRILTVLAIIYTAYFAAPILVPFSLAILLAFTLAPVVRVQKSIGIPAPVGSAVALAITVGVLVLIVFMLSAPATEWASNVPTHVQKLKRKIREIQIPFEPVKEASEEVEKLADEVGENVDNAMDVRIKPPTVLGSALSNAPRILATFVATVFFLYFLLAAGSRLTSKLVRLSPYSVDQQRLTELARSIQQNVSRYLLTVSLINVSLGVVTGLWLWWLGIENPALWGLIVAVMNFAPYVGAVLSAILIAIVSLLQFENLISPLMAVGGYVVFSTLEGQMITPIVLGRRLALSHYVLFTGIICFGWLWGILGALMAVPMMVTAKIVCENIPELRWLAVLIEREQVSDAAQALPELNSKEP